MTFGKKIITIFGGTGFLGRNIIWALAKTGATIRVASRNPKHAYFLRPAGDVGQIVPVACDIRDDHSVAAVLKGATHAINLVGILHESGHSTFFRIHVEAAERIAKACRAANIETLVHVSALGASLDGPSKYLRTKAQGENKVVHAFPRSVILRPGIVFGPDDNFFNMFGRMARNSPVLPLVGGGQTRFQPVYVGDVAKAVFNILSGPAPEKRHGQIYELGGPRVYTMQELLMATMRFAHRPAALLPLPIPLAKALALFTGLLPGKPLTLDQVRTLSKDSILDPGAPGLKALGVEPTALESILPTYMPQYMPGGPLAEKNQLS